MSSGASDVPRNAYLARLGVPVPDLALLARRSDVTLRTLAIAALLERGGPMTRDEIAARLGALLIRGSEAQIVSSLRGALRVGFPLFRESDGRFGLDTGGDWDDLEFRLRVREDMLPTPGPPSDDTPISIEEIEAGLTARGIPGVPPQVLALAFADAARAPVSVAWICDVLTRIVAARGWKSELRDVAAFCALAGDGLVTPGDEREVRAMRASVRRHLWSAGARLIEIRGAEDSYRRADETWSSSVVTACLARRGVVHACARGGEVLAVSILDVASRTVATHVGRERAAAEDLTRFDILAGLAVRSTLASLGAERAFAGRLVDLAGTPASRRVEGGARASVGPKDFIEGSTGVEWAPLSDGAASELLAIGDHAGAVAALEGGAKALHAYYAFGVLHRAVTLRSDGVGGMVPVSWAERTDARITSVLSDAEQGQPVEVVISDPDWDDPWRKAKRVVPERFNFKTVTLEDRGERLVVPVASVKAARFVERCDAR